MTKAKNPRMQVWEAAEKTPVAHTKKVSLGREFTAIDAQYVVMKATELFGVVGQGWGWNAAYEIDKDLDVVIAQVIVWTGEQHHQFGPFASIQPLRMKNGRLDGDCIKKAVTDSLTKCLSHIGIGADVFLGKYDDNKYVAQLREEKKAADAAMSRKYLKDPKDGADIETWTEDSVIKPTDPERDAEEQHRAIIAEDDF